ncbi:MAG: helix-turn-helix domain-containing protein [Anaerolineaceae bacterium]|nr:helix-turn-helix domain-containing protein [Anaerolineaceae bacterium]
MSLIYEERVSDSPFVETIMHGQTVSDGSTIRPAESGWHMVFVRHNRDPQPLLVGPWTTAGVAFWGAGSEILWIRFKLGVFMPHLPPKKFLDTEIALPDASSKSFWLNSSSWQFPDYDNVEAFIDRLVREETLVQDPVVSAAVQDQLPEKSLRTVRHRFRQATGLTQGHIHQLKRAQQTAELLHQGVSILDAVYEMGYFDQPHLTRALKQYIGKTPKQWVENPPAEARRLDEIL